MFHYAEKSLLTAASEERRENVFSCCPSGADEGLAWVGGQGKIPQNQPVKKSRCYHPLMLKKYPHLTLLVFSYAVAIVFFILVDHEVFRIIVEPWGLGGIFIVGMMYAYSFTISAGALLLPAFLGTYTPETVAIIGGLGGMFADITLFRFFNRDLKQELNMLGATRFFKLLARIPLLKLRWMRDAIGFLVIISPLPDEVGIAIMASARLPESIFRALSLVANVIGIYLLLNVMSTFY